ncbi:MAG: HD domain-containing protein [Planctomycetales bacterium]|nr:HD domain-containing protein [Planctomycetales bacterium]
MQQSQLEDYKRWFTGFAAGFYADGDDFLNENIRLKECHTHRVCKQMRDLAAALEMARPDAILAEAIALFHDVGRFPQFQRHRTYKDQISENHCLLALTVLDEHRLLENLPADERAIIKQAVEFHGAKELPALDDRSLHFSKMIRDTDKLDIFDLLVTNYRILADTPEKFKWEIEFPNTPECNPAIIEALLNNTLIDYRLIRTINDAKLLQLGWVFDVYFGHTLKQIRDRGYLQAIISFLPNTSQLRPVTDHILAYVQNRIQM